MGKLVKLNPQNHLDDKLYKWFAVYTKYKCEKQVAQMLECKGIEVYLPLNRVVRNYTRKTKTVELPLLHCYVFVRIIKPQYVPVLETPNVVKFIKFNQSLISIHEEEIEVMRKVCDHFYHIETTEITFQKGLPVELIGGGITGLRGHLVEDQGKFFIVELEGIGVGLRMQIEPHMVRSII